MSLYPSLEDMKVDELNRAQVKRDTDFAPPPYNPAAAYNGPSPDTAGMYPALGNYMGLELSEAVLRDNMPEYLHSVSIYQQQSPIISNGASMMVAPLSSQSQGLMKAQVTHGVREVTLCKDQDNKVGLRVREVNKGIFVSLVVENSPASLVGLRFGDQILQINGTNVAGFSMDKVHDIIKKSPVNGIKLAVRDRPFERTITLHKDSTGGLGFQFKNGKIVAIVKDSSAARNGVLIEHQMLEVDGQNVVGLKDKQVKEIIEKCGNVVTVTVIPSFMFEHMVKKMSGSLLKDLMDHSVPIL